jgi:hypothetical protein
MEAGCARACGVEKDFLFQKSREEKARNSVGEIRYSHSSFLEIHDKRPRPKGQSTTDPDPKDNQQQTPTQRTINNRPPPKVQSETVEHSPFIEYQSQKSRPQAEHHGLTERMQNSEVEASTQG